MTFFKAQSTYDFLVCKIAQLFKVFLNYSVYASIEMSVVPYGAFAAHKVRQNEDKLKKEYEVWDLTQTKYSSKYMNSVWGMYNRYSVHNLKKNIDEKMFAFQAQQETVGAKLSADKNSADLKGSLSATNFLPSPGLL